MNVKANDGGPTVNSGPQTLDVPPASNLPVVVAAAAATSKRRPWLLAVLLTLIFVGAAGGGTYWWTHRSAGLPPGIVAGNGRIEADEIDIATKFAGRIAEIFFDEGDRVKAGQILARMDTRDLEAAQKKAEAQVRQAQKVLDGNRANLEQQKTQVTLAKQQWDRTHFLLVKGYATREEFDQRQQQLDAASAAMSAAKARVSESEHALDAAERDVERNSIDIADNSLIAPRDGQIQYRLANVGEVLGAGGKVFTVLDATYVYMDVFLPTAEAGRAAIGSEARIVLDALPNAPIPAKITFVSAQAQFTPKAVETKSERDKLMFRVRIRIDPDRLRSRPAELRAGLPGVAYVRLDAQTRWPPFLESPTGG